ncbi:DMT family transporter [Neptunicella marina]|uniref:DMT family transporter n=1 Tax=Neptunicella marina TaxID=2125989 RepID=A0A8J6IXN8_9ALTE|nr:DMT family transporter [Neptunicella marina]MBC3767128.1 DMT family transporter [Neptunicella marina]
MQSLSSQQARLRVMLLSTLAMIAFAANSLLCRAALSNTSIDAASFTTIRLVSGALVLWLLLQAKRQPQVSSGNWLSALALFTYAAGFSFAYISLSTGTGALILFGAVQATMIGYGIWQKERFTHWQILGLLLAFSGLVGLLLPGLSAPPPGGALLMMLAGMAWGVYSLRGKGAGNPTQITAGNFVRSLPLALVLSLFMLSDLNLDWAGIIYAIASGALASGVGYAIWYAALPALKATSAATMQLSVPVIAAIAGIVFLNEPVTLRLTLASLAILGGIALVILVKPKLKSA